MELNIPLFEYDSNKQAIIEPIIMNPEAISFKKDVFYVFFRQY